MQHPILLSLTEESTGHSSDSTDWVGLARALHSVCTSKGKCVQCRRCV